MSFSEAETVEKQSCSSGIVVRGPEHVLLSSFLPSLLHKLVDEIIPLHFNFMQGFIFCT